MVYTCLSHDIVAHETAHAIVDRLRPGFNQVTNHDMLAFHEAFADLVAIFQHFKIEQVLVDAINERKPLPDSASPKVAPWSGTSSMTTQSAP